MRDIRSPGETLDGLLAAFFFIFFFLKSLKKPRDIVLKRPHTAELHGTFKDVFFFFLFFSRLVTPQNLV